MNRANLYDPLPLESEPVRKAAGADQPTEKNAADPMPLGPFTKAKKIYRVGDTFLNASGETATVVEVTKGHVRYTFAGGHGELLNV